MTRRLLQPLVLVALVALVLLSARLAGAQQTSTRRMAVATRAIARGTVLTAGDFEYRDSTARSSAPADSTPVVAGWVTRRMIAPGEVLRTPAVEPPALVTANQPVEIEFRDQNVSLIMRGTATRSASIGEHVTVRTEQGKRVEATVIAAGRVRID